ncbi:MAG: hypothetical protein ABIA75_02500 [Candidatus Neomarinimicrobiota bacterium]
MKVRLIDAIIQIRNKGDLSAYDESATKQVILLRILNALGWDTFDREEVFPEYGNKGKRVDYSLRHRNENKVFIEAKRIREDLDSHQEQLLQYSFEEGVTLAILTNGLTWWFYLPLVEGLWEQRKFYTIDFLNQEPDEIADKFNDYLSKDNVISNKATDNAKDSYYSKKKIQIIKDTLPQAFDRIISEPDEFFVELLVEKTEEISGHRPETNIVEQFLKDRKSTLYTQQVHKSTQPTKTTVTVQQPEKTKDKIFTEETLSLEKLLEKDLGYSKPLELKINNDQMIVSSWTEVSVKFVQWLLNNGHLRNYNIPIFNSSYTDKYFINTEPVHQKKTRDGSWKEVEQLFVDIKYSAKNTVKNIIATIEQLHLENIKSDISITLKSK